jgi:hypothetical protein
MTYLELPVAPARLPHNTEQCWCLRWLPPRRFFLVDLRIQPVNVKQFKHDLAELFLKEDAGKEELKNAVDKLTK